MARCTRVGDLGSPGERAYGTFRLAPKEAVAFDGWALERAQEAFRSHPTSVGGRDDPCLRFNR